MINPIHCLKRKLITVGEINLIFRFCLFFSFFSFLNFLIFFRFLIFLLPRFYFLGEKVSQGKIRNRGLEYLESEFPKLDYITSCDLIEEDVPWSYVHGVRTDPV